MSEPTGQRRDVIDILANDHRQVDQLFGELERINARDRAKRQELTDRLVMALIPHLVAEEAEVYPVIKAKGRATWAERAIREHAEAEETMKHLDRLRSEDPHFDEELTTLRRQIRKHIEEEESEIFPYMRESFSPAELMEYGDKVEACKKKGPTRPHPLAPDEPPLDRIVGRVAGVFDRVRDAVTGRGARG